MRARAEALAVAIASVAVFASLFLHWYQPGSHFLVLFGALDKLTTFKTGWQIFTFTDLLLAAIAAGGLALAVVLPRVGRPPLLACAVLAGAGIVATARAMADPPLARAPGGRVELAPDVGAYVALAGLVALAAAVLVAATARRAAR